MFVLYANKNQLSVRKREPVTSGSVNVYTARFEFSDAWEGLTTKAVFRGSGKTISVLLDKNGECVIPWETLTKHGVNLYAGVCGTLDDTVLPTVWADFGPILEGVVGGAQPQPPTPDLWEQELAKKGDNLKYTEDGALGLYSGYKLLSSVHLQSGGGEIHKYKFGHGLKFDGATVSVDAVNNFTGDNTLPMTAAGVLASVGNIEALLETI